MKLADIILHNYSLLSVLPRFGIRFGFGEKSLSEVCAKYNINEALFLLICNVYTFEEYLPQRDELSKLDIDSLIGYLQSSHNYYVEEKMTSIEKQLNSMCECSNGTQHQIIRTFFNEYKNEIVNHFDYEENKVFPYIKSLMKGETQVDYHINQYEKNHSNIEDKLSDLKNIIIKYLPESYSSKFRNEVVFDIFLFEQDLVKHSLIEDKVLVPFVREIELRYE